MNLVKCNYQPLTANIRRIASLPAEKLAQVLDGYRVPRTLPAVVTDRFVVEARPLNLTERLSYLAGRLETQAQVAAFLVGVKRVRQ